MDTVRCQDTQQDDSQSGSHVLVRRAIGLWRNSAALIPAILDEWSTPMVLTAWGGDANSKNCSAVIDTSRLVGRKDKDRLILLCGVADPRRDPIEDDRIAVSQPFTITGQATGIVAPYGAMSDALEEMSKLAGNQAPQLPNPGFMLWHTVAVIPKDVNVAEIKRVSDVAKRGGKIVTEPQAGAYGSAQPFVASPIVPLPLAPKTKKS